VIGISRRARLQAIFLTLRIGDAVPLFLLIVACRGIRKSGN